MSTTTTCMGLVKPDTNDKITQTISDLSANFAIIDALYPVGTIYTSTVSTDPGTFIGGTWNQLQGRMLVGQSTDFPAGTTGGEATHTLTIAEMPAHTHPVNGAATGGTSGHGVAYSDSVKSDFSTTLTAGSGQAHNNMPPYKAVYMWERTA